MCGIFGIFYLKNKIMPDRQHLEKTARIIQHRGPDSSGVYVDNGIGIAHTRLSLLDISSRSDQPFWDKSGRYCLIYNGEIYNFKELRSDLENVGRAFETTSDTEVLLQGLIEMGPAILQKLEGMFAFALYDKKEDSLLIARDRFGIKPLYIYSDAEKFIFASEIKAMQSWVPAAPDMFSISSYLQGFGGPTQNFTFFSGIKILQTGGIIKIQSGGISESKNFFPLENFWSSDLSEQYNFFKPSQLVDRLEELLLISVKKHLIADTQVGALCSGGIDSSLIMAMAAKVHSNLAIFHANVRGPHSEYEAAQLLATHLKLKLNVVDVNDHDFIEGIPDVMYHYGHPFLYHPNSIPFLMVAQLVRQNGVKAILTGEAADECFLGYSHLPTENLFSGYYKALDRIKSLVHMIPSIGKLLWRHTGTSSAIIRGLHNRFENDIDKERILSKLGHHVSKNNLKTLEYLGYHLRTLLHRNDSLGMAASIEARFPFLDNALVEYAVNLPYRYKIRASFSTPIERKHPFIRNKWVLREVANRYLPKALSQRPKRGFPTDAFERMRVAPGYFNNSFVSHLFGLSSNETAYLVNNAGSNLVLRLLHLDIWGRVCFNQEPRESARNDLKKHISF